jgi:hypothetical protein
MCVCCVVFEVVGGLALWQSGLLADAGCGNWYDLQTNWRVITLDRFI